MILVVDNYDSFTFNLVQAFRALGSDVTVRTSDAVSVPELAALKPSQLVVSPGPGGPQSSGASIAAIQHFAGRIPVLGVCLGHQALAVAFGGRVVRAAAPMHGKVSEISHAGVGIFRAAPTTLAVGRYHSLVVERATLPPAFAITAATTSGEIMGLRHAPTGAEGVQFHPESILTPWGSGLLLSFLRC